MTEDNNKQRPVRKLTVDNFSVIKHAELEFGKITVLIGPQASGKSLLCKLAYFFSQYLPDYANGVARREPPFDEISAQLEERFVDWFPKDAWASGHSKVSYRTGRDSVSITSESPHDSPILSFSSGFPSEYERWKASKSRTSEATFEPPFTSSGSTYIPSGRAFFSTPNRGFVAASEKNLDWITQRFSTEVDWDYKSLIRSGAQTLGELGEFGRQAAGILGGKVIKGPEGLRFVSEDDSRRLPFSLLSSGTLELLPLLCPLSDRVANSSINRSLEREVLPALSGTIYIEEPELSIFPATQNLLVHLFAWLSNVLEPRSSLAITTHSPYILTAFNNLIEAAQVAAAKPDLKSEVAKLIPERYWIRPGDFKAYAIEDGVLKSIVAEDTGLVSANYLDQVSETIGAEFDELLRLGYVES